MTSTTFVQRVLTAIGVAIGASVTAQLPTALAQTTTGGQSILGWGTQATAPQHQLLNVTSIAAGSDHSLAVKSDGSVVAWGMNISAQCRVPQPNAGFVAADGGDSHSLGLRADGSIVTWGINNLHGQLDVPNPNEDFIAIAAGYSHNLALKADGSVVAWGNNDGGQTNVPAPNVGFTAIAAAMS